MTSLTPVMPFRAPRAVSFASNDVDSARITDMAKIQRLLGDKKRYSATVGAFQIHIAPTEHSMENKVRISVTGPGLPEIHHETHSDYSIVTDVHGTLYPLRFAHAHGQSPDPGLPYLAKPRVRNINRLIAEIPEPPASVPASTTP